MSTKALIIVDVQNDFCEAGSLAVPGANKVAGGIHEMLVRGHDYGVVVATRDWHAPGSDNGGHIATTCKPDFVTTWPAHCVQGTAGAEFHPDIATLVLDGIVTDVVSKGLGEPAYSGFQGVAKGSIRLDEILDGAFVTDVDIVGIAIDYCVNATARDAAANGFRVRVLLDLCAGVAPESTRAAIKAMQADGVEVDGVKA